MTIDHLDLHGRRWHDLPGRLKPVGYSKLTGTVIPWYHTLVLQPSIVFGTFGDMGYSTWEGALVMLVLLSTYWPEDETMERGYFDNLCANPTDE